MTTLIRSLSQEWIRIFAANLTGQVMAKPKNSPFVSVG